MALSFVLLGISFGQSPITFYDSFDVEDGLKDRAVLRIDRDEKGHFWLLQANNIQEFNGSFFTDNINHDFAYPRNFKYLSGHRLFLSSYNNEAIIIDLDSKTTQNLDLQLEDCQDCTLIDHNLIDENLFLYYASENEIKVVKRSLSGSNLAKTKITTIHYSSPQEIRHIFKIEDIYLLIDEDDNLVQYDNYFKTLNTTEKSRSNIRSIECSYINDRNLIFSLPKKLGTYQFINGELKTIHEKQKLAFAKEDRNGKLYLGLSDSYRHTEHHYIWNNGMMRKWHEMQKISGTAIDVYIEDTEDKILMGTHTGLKYVKLSSPGILASHQSTTRRDGFGNVIMSFAEWSDSLTYYAKEAGGLYQYNGSKGPTEFKAEEVIKNNMHMLADTKNNRLWIGGYSNVQTGILHSIDMNSGKVVEYPFEKAILFYTISTDSTLIINTGTTQGSSIVKYNVNSKRIEETLIKLDEEKIRKFYQLDDEHLLIGTNQRMFKYSMKSKEISDVLPDTWVQSFAPFRKGWMVGSFGKGTLFLDHDLKILKSFDSDDGLTNNYVYNVTEDLQGRIWIGTGYGLNVIDTSLTLIKRIFPEDGISDKEFNTNATVLLKNGNILFGTTNGVTEVNPEVALSSVSSSRFNVPSVEYEIGGEVVSQEVVNHQIQISSKAKNLKIKIESNDFHNKNKTATYSPRIVTIDPQLSSFSSTLDFLTIPKLKDEKTTVQISSANPNAEESIYNFTISTKKDYSTLLLGSMIFLLVGLASYLISRRIIKQNRRREDERRKNEVKMAELELQALRSQMNPHFIFNSLGAILLYMQTNEKKMAEKYLTKFAKLMRMFLESSKSKFISFKEELELLSLYTELEKLRFEEKFDYEIKIDDRIDKNGLTLPSMLLQPFVENAINHGLYHMKAGNGLLKIKATPSKNNVIVTIEDNGVGRAKAREIREQSLKKHRSRATEIITERIQVLKKEKNIDIDIRYEDLYAEEGCASGTKVTITIPKLLKTYD